MKWPIKHALKSITIVILIVPLFSCSVFGPVKTVTPTSYTLSATSHTSAKKTGRHINIFVAPVTANSLYQTNEIAYSTKPYQVDYYVKNQWAESPAKMLRPLIVKSLQNSHYFYRVSTNSGFGHFDYILNVELTELRQVFSAHANIIRLSLHAELLCMATGKVATKDINVIEGVHSVTPYAAVMAANRAVARALTNLTKFTFTAKCNVKKPAWRFDN